MRKSLVFFYFIINSLKTSWSRRETEHTHRPAQHAGTRAIGLPRRDPGPRTVLPGIETSTDKVAGRYPGQDMRFSVAEVNIESRRHLAAPARLTVTLQDLLELAFCRPQ